MSCVGSVSMEVATISVSVLSATAGWGYSRHEGLSSDDFLPSTRNAGEGPPALLSHRLDEPPGLSLCMVAAPQCPLPFPLAKSLELRHERPFLNILFSRDSAGTQTPDTPIARCDPLV